jgi:hypothetical protein
VNDQISFVVEKKASNNFIPAKWKRLQDQLVDVAEGQVHAHDNRALAIVGDSLMANHSIYI